MEKKYKLPELTLEQQFNLRAFEENVNRMNLEQARGFLTELYGLMLTKENLYKSIIKNMFEGKSAHTE